MKIGLGLVLFFLCSCIGTRPSRDELISAVETALSDGKSETALALIQKNRWALKSNDSVSCALTLAEIEALLDTKKDSQASLLLRDLVVEPSAPAEIRAQFAMVQGLVAIRAHNNESANDLLQEAQSIALSLPMHRVLAKVYNMRAYLCYLAGNQDGAIHFDTLAVFSARIVNEAPTRIKSLNNLGLYRLKQCNYEAAISYLEEARGLLDPEDPALGGLLVNLGASYSLVGDFLKADAVFKQAFSITKITKVNLQQCTGEFGIHCIRVGKLEEAKRNLEDAFNQSIEAQDWTNAGLWAGSLALVMHGWRNWKEGSRWVNEAYKFRALAKDGSDDTWLQIDNALIEVGICRFDRAEPLILELLVKANTSGDPNLSWQARFAMGRLLAEMGREEEAFQVTQEAIDLIEQNPGMVELEGQILLFNNLVSIHKTLVAYLMTHDQQERAFRVVESSRARMLRFRAAVGQSAPEVQVPFSVPVDTVVLVYWLAEGQSYLWTVTQEGRQVYFLPGRDSIEALVASHNKNLSDLKDPVRTGFADSYALLEMLTQPAVAQFQGKKHVVIVPDGDLHKLAFGTLPSPLVKGHYWVEDLETSVTPALSLYLQPKRATSKLSSLLLVGDPNYNSKLWPNLPGTVAELATIQSHFPNKAVRLLTGSAATRQAFFADNPGEFEGIHFAAHAVANDFSPLSSAVILAPEDDLNPSRISAQDIMGCDLRRVSLVTLSACSSAGTQSFNGEGLTGLAWAFLWSGVSNVVATGWNVDDRATAELMDGFYAHLSAEETPAQALREAQLNLVHSQGRYRKPYYWGAFQVFVR